MLVCKSWAKNKIEYYCCITASTVAGKGSFDPAQSGASPTVYDSLPVI
jgi:hypothetical protein